MIIPGCYTRSVAKTERNYEIHARYKCGERKINLAREYGISNERVREIIKKIDSFIQLQDQSAGAKET